MKIYYADSDFNVFEFEHGGELPCTPDQWRELVERIADDHYVEFGGEWPIEIEIFETAACVSPGLGKWSVDREVNVEFTASRIDDEVD